VSAKPTEGLAKAGCQERSGLSGAFGASPTGGEDHSAVVLPVYGEVSAKPTEGLAKAGCQERSGPSGAFGATSPLVGRTTQV